MPPGSINPNGPSGPNGMSPNPCQLCALLKLKQQTGQTRFLAGEQDNAVKNDPYGELKKGSDAIGGDLALKKKKKKKE